MTRRQLELHLVRFIKDAYQVFVEQWTPGRIALEGLDAFFVASDVFYEKMMFEVSSAVQMIAIDDADGVFDFLDVGFVDDLKLYRDRLVEHFTVSQRVVFDWVLNEGRVLEEDDQALGRRLLEVFFLTRPFVKALYTYRSSLQAGEVSAPELRDRRFDRNGAVPANRVSRIVGRYADRVRAHRTRTIAERESYTVFGMATYWSAMLSVRKADDIPALVWSTILDGNERSSHGAMDGQIRRLGVPFVSGDGYQLRYPHDPRAPLAETVNCRCRIRRIFISDDEEDFQ